MTEYIEQTQKELGAIISSPKLTDKLLSRPPFQFLHDVVMNFQQATGFPKGLYSAEMEDKTKVADKESKKQFLDLLIAAVEAATGKGCPAKSAKIVAGHEPEHTNTLLQMLASCAALPDDKKAAAVLKAKGATSSPAAAPTPKAKERSKSTSDEAKEKPKEKSKETEKPKEKSKETEKSKEKSKDKEKEKTTETEEERHKRHEEERRKRHEERKREKEKEDDKEDERRRRHEEKKRERDEERRKSGNMASEPALAGKAPPRTKPTHEVIASPSAVDGAPVAGVIRETKRSTEDDGSDAEVEDWQKVAEQYDSKQGKGKRKASVGDDAEVKGALGQQALRAKRDQEAAARQAKEDPTVAPPKDGGIIIRGRKGAATEGSGAMGDNELSKLREQLQLLTKASNPLGKFLEAIHDDIDSMLRELDMWRSEARSQALAATEARHQTEESLQEVHAQLQNLEDAINDQISKTNLLRQKIITNDKSIHGMMRTIVNPEVASRQAAS